MMNHFKHNHAILPLTVIYYPFYRSFFILFMILSMNNFFADQEKNAL